MFPTIEFVDGEQGLASPPFYVADLDRCEPGEALSPLPTPGHWHAYGYETDLVTGVILSAGEESDPPDLTYPLDVTGWHAISIGLYQDRYYGDMAVQVRLTDDPGFSVLTVKDGPLDIIYDVFWKIADLTGQQVTFGQLKGRIFQGWRVDELGTRARIAYIKLVPLTPAEVRTLQDDRARKDTKRLFTHQDGGLLAALMRDGTAAEVNRELEGFRDTDFSRMYWEAGFGDILLFPGKTGRQPAFPQAKEFPFVAERLGAESWRRTAGTGFDSFGLALERAHQIGLEFHACYRPAGFYFPPPEEYFNQGGFYEQHPELRAISREGQPLSRIAYTFPETRSYVLSVLREVAEYPIDGISILYNRAPPLLAYEPSLVEGFIEMHGEDPRALPEDDPRWLTYRGSVLTGFMRELRTAMDGVVAAKGRSKRISITAVVLGRPEENHFHGMNVPEWIAEGLVDTVVPFTEAMDMNSAAESWVDLELVKQWVATTRGTPTTLAMNILPRWMSPAAYRRKAAQLYELGVENLFFWDGYMRVNYFDQLAWNAMRQLGHREEVERWTQTAHPGYPTTWVMGEDTAAVGAWLAAGKPPLGPSSVVLRRLADWDLATGTPG